MNDGQGGGGGGHQYQPHLQPPHQQQQHQQQQNRQTQQQPHHNPHLGVHKMGKAIKKSPIHQPNFANPANRPQQPPQPQPQVYNISKNDFRSIVQQLTSGTPSRDPSPNPPTIPNPSPQPPPRPANPHRPQQSERLKRIRPPPLTPIARPAIPQPRPQPPLRNPNPIPIHNPNHAVNPNQNLNPSFMPRPPPSHPPAQFPPLSPLFTPSPLSIPFWASATESPVSAYMRYLEKSISNPEASRNLHLPYGQAQHQQQQQGLPSPHSQFQQPQAPVQSGAPPPPSTGLLPTPSNGPAAAFPSPRGLGPSQLQAGFFPSPGMPSPGAFSGLLSPRSPYPLLSPGFQFPPPLSPSFFNSPLPGSNGILGPGPQLPPSPGYAFPPSPYSLPPLSPSAFLLSPRWRM